MFETLNKIHASLERIEARQTLILLALAALVKKESSTMSDLSAITAAVAAQTTVVASINTLLTQLTAEVQSNATDPAALAALTSQITQNQQSLAAAVLANTPAAIPPPVAPPATA